MQAGDPTNPGVTMAGLPQKIMSLTVAGGSAEASTRVKVWPSFVVSFSVIVEPCFT